MQSFDNNTKAFFELLRAGLWEQEARLFQFGEIDYKEVYRRAEAQSVVGLVGAGLEHVTDVVLRRDYTLAFVRSALQLEQQNIAMNQFIGEVVRRLCEAGIRVLLVKGSAIAQCYSRPLLRSCGDIDLFFSKAEHDKAVALLSTMATRIVQDSHFTKSVGLLIDGWFVEAHGTLRCGLSSKLVKETDNVQRHAFGTHYARTWKNGNVDVHLPDVDSDLFLLFTHFVRHFYKGGVTLKQLCDWCRFLYLYHCSVDVRLLEERLNRTNLIQEWKSFAHVVIEYLGMPAEAIPLFSYDNRQQSREEHIISFILDGGMHKRLQDILFISRIFPLNTFKFLPSILFNLNGIKLKEFLSGTDNNREEFEMINE